MSAHFVIGLCIVLFTAVLCFIYRNEEEEKE